MYPRHTVQVVAPSSEAAVLHGSPDPSFYVPHGGSFRLKLILCSALLVEAGSELLRPHGLEVCGTLTAWRLQDF